MKYRTIKSDKIIALENGSKRSSSKGKGRPALMPPHALLRIAKLYERGADIYGAFNCEIGQYHSRYLDSLFRHLLKYLGGASDEDHLAAICWNAMEIMHQEEMIERKLLDAKYDDHRVLVDKNGTQLIPRCIFHPDEFNDGVVLDSDADGGYTRSTKKACKKKVSRKCERDGKRKSKAQ